MIWNKILLIFQKYTRLKYLIYLFTFQVHVTALTLRQIDIAMTASETLHPNLFQGAQKHIYHIMEHDSLPRFLESVNLKNAPLQKSIFVRRQNRKQFAKHDLTTKTETDGENIFSRIVRRTRSLFSLRRRQYYHNKR